MMVGSYDSIYASIIRTLAGHQPRIMIGIAGPPGVGKSTLSSQLCKQLNLDGYPAAIVQMDGFHLDNSILRERGLLHRKGAPETFDAEGFVALARTLRAGNVPVAIPDFDREADQVREAVETIAAACKVVLLEGNYLLLDRQPWTQLQSLFDLSVFVKASPQILRERLIQRWLDLGHDRNDAEQRANGNDIPNANLVLDHSVPADFTLDFESGD